MVVQVCDSVNLLISYKFCNLGDQTCLVYQIWKLCNDNSGFSVRKCLYICYGTYTDLSTACSVGFFNSSSAKNCSSSWEIRSFYNVQDLFHCGFTLLFDDIVNNLDNSVYNLPQIMRRDIGSHTYCDTGSSVYQKIRVTGWQYNRFSLCLIKVWLEINGILVDVCQHFHGNLAQTCLGISHGCCTITIHGTKISMSVYQRISGRPFLCHIYKCAIDRTVTVWVIFTHCITDNTRTLTMRLVRTVV